MAEHGGASEVHEDEDADGCDLDFNDEPTADSDLPAASGGVELPEGQGDDDTDACDLNFDDGDPTTDEQLPVAVGGGA